MALADYKRANHDTEDASRSKPTSATGLLSRLCKFQCRTKKSICNVKVSSSITGVSQVCVCVCVCHRVCSLV